MAQSRNYRQIGVFLPIERDGESERVLHDSTVPQNDEFMRKGFLFAKDLQMGVISGKYWLNGNRAQVLSVFVVQSVSTGELFVNKLMEVSWDPTTQLSRPPRELRASTYRHAVGDPTIDGYIPGPNGNDVYRKGVLPSVPYFNRLRFWQELDPQDITSPNCTVYSLFYEFCNGGTLLHLMYNYCRRGKAIPEHFIWHVAEQLFLALVAMNFGSYSGRDDGDNDDANNQPNNWARIYHRDMHSANVFIHYPPRGRGRISRAGLESNAFPDIVVGDFGNAGIQGDDPASLPPCNLADPTRGPVDPHGFMEEWEDIFAAGTLLREMTMTHITVDGSQNNPYDSWHKDFRPHDRWVQAVNQQPTAPPYSAELIQLLERFEYPEMMNFQVRDLLDDVHTAFPSPEDLRDNLLPQVQARVAAFRRPDNIPAGYYDSMDVSWTRPDEVVPFSYVMKYATEAGDAPGGGPPPEHDDGDSEGNQDDSASDDNEEGGDVEPQSSSQPDKESPVQASDGTQQPENSEDSGAADDNSHDDDESSYPSPIPQPPPPPPPPPPPSEQLAMRELRKMHKWNEAKPRYELCTLELHVPVVLPHKAAP